ncbi:uncharacterized protein LOC111018723 [Momordica charantia]|uniref:Uncharacterized protein LOC111018723 n=1 Tax=Momordica charantia TaxID=3673 RepID=A0A6J1D9Z1_MOMCH|nr:uncharacterized protein LOC111018723 [Momordica charantia]
MVHTASSAPLCSFHFRSPSSWRRRPAADHRRAPRCHSGVSDDEENQKDIVEANLTVLRERMEDLRKKERRIPASGGRIEFDNCWSYMSRSDAKLDRDCERKMVKNFALISECLEVISMAGGAVGLVLVGGSLGICLVSLLIRHLSN